MAIAKMNTFFARHHRIIFGVITVIIIIAFTDFLTPGTGIVEAFRGNSRRNYAGEIFGRKVGYGEVYDQAAIDMLGAYVFMGIPLNGDVRQKISEQAFYSLAHLTAARRAGLRISDEEVTRFLRRFFRNEAGDFSEEIYRNVVDSALAAEGFTEEMLFTAAGQYLLLTKFSETLRAGVVVTPGELELFRKMLAEEFEVMTANFTAADFLAQVKDDPAELENFFRSRRGHYLIPAVMQAVVAAFPYAEFQAEAAGQATPEAVKQFYEANQALFSEVKDGKVAVKPFEQVADEAKNRMAAAAARALALEKANEFVAAAYEAVGNVKPEERAALFHKMAGERKLSLMKTGKVSADAKTARPIAEPALVAELAGVFADVPITNAVPGAAAAYVGYVTELIPGRQAELAEVKDHAERDFRQARALELARNRAAEVSGALQALPDAGRPARVKSAVQPAFQTLPKFTRMKGAGGALPAYLMEEVTNLQVGAVSRPLPTADGALVIYMAKRSVPAADGKADPMLEAMFRNYKQSLAQAEFQAYLSANCVRYADPSGNAAE